MTQTHWKKLNNPDYLGSYFLEPGQELIGTIKVVKKEVVTGADGKKEECTVIHFVEPGLKPMILNTTNAKMISKIHKTPYIEEWAGKKIQIYSTEVKAFGDVVEALRIRPKIPETVKPSLTPTHPKWPAALKSIEEGIGTIEAIRKHYTLTAEDEKLLLTKGGADNA
jgi:hypothetical protein